MTKKEKKKWLLDHKEEIKEFCKKSFDYWDASFKRIDDLFIKYYKEHDPEQLQDYKKRCVYTKQMKKEDYKNEVYGMLHAYDEEEVGDKEELLGNNISKYLKKFRNDYEESALVLYLKGKKIIKSRVYKGGVATCFGQKEQERVINNAKRYKADVYMCHNHPLHIVAKLSGKADGKIGDYSGLRIFTLKCKENNINVVGFGIVTAFDYLSVDVKVKKRKGTLTKDDVQLII